MDSEADQVSQTAEDPSRHAELEIDNQKVSAILEACRWNNVNALQSLAESEGGFLTDELRRKAWPVLLGVPNSQGEEERADDTPDASWKELPRHRDEEQVQLDVNRAFIYYPVNQTDAQLDERKRELSELITHVLRRYPYLCYFQGYHDICQVFLLVLASPNQRARLVARLSALRIRDYMLTTLEPTIHQLRLIPDILGAADPSLRRHLADTEPFYALAGTLTMYAHDIQTYGDIARLFDVLLSREPVFSIYLFAQIVLHRRDELFEQDPDDPSMLHLILSKMPQKMDLEKLIADTARLFRRFPPESLPAWRRISAASCLKTARSTEDCAKQTMEEGKAFFEKQLKELQAAERRRKVLKTMWRYRKTAAALGLAVAVGLIAVYIPRDSGPFTKVSAFFSKFLGR
ncbi:hypothetical protein ACRALDRAFT_2108678 [Sodiomyces alcalophilus JCM 7366]|uniref:uncharacterized protein n=1 Tax=Sodiomyces alcalophilus JCM 7366 TaxID=591952 RepID=UPI0039B653BB